MKQYIIALLISFLFIPITNAQKMFNIIDFGAKPNSKFVNTNAINTAIAACNKAGGGIVLVPSGTFLSGTINLLSNIDFHLEIGAVIKGSDNLKDFENNGVMYGLFYTEDQENVSISGKGTIDGNGSFYHMAEIPHGIVNGDGTDSRNSFTRQGAAYMNFKGNTEDGPVGYKARPNITLYFSHCTRVSFTDFLLKNSPSWSMRLNECEEVIVDRITMRNNMLIPNSDGIHSTSSCNVRISNCDLQCGDDAIIVSGYSDYFFFDNNKIEQGKKYVYGSKVGKAENFVVTNCILSSRSAGIRIGYGYQDIRHCYFSNIVIFNSNRGILINARDKGSIDDISFENISIETRFHTGHWWGKAEPIHISAIPESLENNKKGTINNVRFKGININAETGIVVWGENENDINNISFQDITMHIRKGKYSELLGGNLDLRPAYDVKRAIFGKDIAGLYARNVNGIEIAGLKITHDENLPDFYTNGIWIENFKKLFIENSQIKSLNGKSSNIKLENGDGVKIINTLDLFGEKVTTSYTNITNIKTDINGAQ
jgi:polygalacturonase